MGAPVQDAASVEPSDGEEPKHVLVLGDKSFVCRDKLPVSTLIRYADSGLESTHHVLVKLVHEDDLEEMWDAFEELDDEETAEAFRNLLSSYSDRPQKRPRR